MTDWGSRALEAQKALRSDLGSWKRFLRDLQTAAGEGDADAMEALGGWLQEGLRDETGEVVSEPALKKAVGWFERAAEQSHAGALHQLAYCNDVGLGVKQDRLQAIALYRRAVSAGQEMSALNVAICYRELGNLRGYRRWIERAARSGSVEAQLQLAEWRLTRRTTKAQKKKAIRSLRRLVRHLGEADPKTQYPDELPRAKVLLEQGKQMQL